MSSPGREDRPWDDDPDRTSRKADGSLVGCLWILVVMGVVFFVVVLWFLLRLL
jgi:hypothetical protein